MGAKLVLCTATDTAGNSASAQGHYQVDCKVLTVFNAASFGFRAIALQLQDVNIVRHATPAVAGRHVEHTRDGPQIQPMPITPG
jgi:hypothetical protein